MMCYGALKNNIDFGLGQYCFSVLHNTSYCTQWSAIIVYYSLAVQTRQSYIYLSITFWQISPFKFGYGSRYGEKNCTPATQRKYIVFESQLLDLFKTCPSCSSPSLADIKQIVGSMVKIHQSCGICGFSRIWDSQPSIGAVPAGNLLMSAAILFSGLCLLIA